MSVFTASRPPGAPLAGLMSLRDFRAARRAPAGVNGSTRLLGEPVTYADGPAFLYSVREIFQDEVYKFEAKTAAPRIVDAGANIGLSVRYFKRLYPQATVVAYEPDTAVFQILKRNTADLDGVELRQAAAWIEDTELSFFSDTRLAGSLALDYWGDDKRITVKAERLRDELVKAPVDFLKIDIEGAENSVMFDIEDQLDRVDHLFFEYHSTAGETQRLGDLLNLVQRHGFRYTSRSAHGAARPFVQPTRHGYDSQMNVSCVRVD